MSRSTISTFQLFELFPDEETAREYLEGRLWPNGVICPTCKAGDRITPRKKGFYRCNACQLDFTIRTGTVLERSKVPLHKWVYSMYLLVTARKGISSLQLAQEIGVTQKTAWFILGRLREACGTPGTPGDKLSRYCRDRRRMKNARELLDKITDVVLNYRPKSKAKKARKRTRRGGCIIPQYKPRRLLRDLARGADWAGGPESALQVEQLESADGRLGRNSRWSGSR